MRRLNIAIWILTGSVVSGWAQLAPPAREIPLYSGVAPGSEKWNYPERTAGTPARPQAQNIVRPVLLYYPADKPSAVGTAMIVAPGGGFRTLMMSYEGVDVAKRPKTTSRRDNHRRSNGARLLSRVMEQHWSNDILRLRAGGRARSPLRIVPLLRTGSNARIKWEFPSWRRQLSPASYRRSDSRGPQTRQRVAAAAAPLVARLRPPSHECSGQFAGP